MSVDYTPSSWATALLTRIGEPATESNTAAVVAWEAAEGGNWHNTARYNPLNTTYATPGSSTMNSAGVRAYTSWDEGLSATSATLMEAPYTGIIAALDPGNDPGGVVTAVINSPWGTKKIQLGQAYDGSGGTTATPASATTDALGSLLGGSGLQSLLVQGLAVAGAVALLVAGLAKATGTHPLRAAGKVGKAAGTAALL